MLFRHKGSDGTLATIVQFVKTQADNLIAIFTVHLQKVVNRCFARWTP